MKRAAQRRAHRALVLLGIAAAGCSSGGGGGGGGTVAPVGCADFTTMVAASPGNVSSAKNAGASICGVVAVDVFVTDVNGIFAVSFTANWDPAVVTYSGFDTSGSVLSSDGAMLDVQQSVSNGQVVIGITRLGTLTGIDAVGTQLIGTLTFSRFNVGVSNLSYSAPTLFDAQTPPQPIPGVSWSGGSLLVR